MTTCIPILHFNDVSVKLVYLSSDVFNPSFAPVMMDGKGHLGKLIRTHKDVYRKGWKFQHKGTDKSQWYCKSPHGSDVQNHTILAVAAATEQGSD